MIDKQTDPMERRSADSASMLDYWNLTDTIVRGIDALRLEGTTFLPKFPDEDEEDYKFRLSMTKYTNVYRDIVESLAAKPFEEATTLVGTSEAPVPQQLTEFSGDVDGSSNNLTVFAANCFFNGVNSALSWILVDYSEPDMTVRSLADAKRAGMRPFWTHILARNMLWVASEMVGGEEKLAFVKIFEPGETNHVRVFERMADGTVVWRLFAKTETEHDMPPMLGAKPGEKTRYMLVKSGDISIGEIPLVPFVTGRRNGRTWSFSPAMRDAAELSRELYQQESGLKYIKQLTAYPMLAGNGVKAATGQDGKPLKLRVGPKSVLYAPPDGNGSHGEWSYVEPSAESLKFLAEDVAETIRQLRELGRQPLTAQSGNLTSITTMVAAGKAKSAVKQWALMLKDALENAFVLTEKWLNVSDYKPNVNVFIEFDDFLDGKDLDTLNTAREKRDISQETYWDELKRRRVLSADFDPDNERKRLLDETPSDGEDTTTE